jgi:uncharacterized membrane protein YedE/YeeE
MKNIIVSFFVGIVFSIGLSLSGMVNPNKVKGFLDVTGNWDPSLVFVMGGALVFAFVIFRYGMGKGKPLMADQFFLPTNNQVDNRLVLGAILFGAGWGITGICPGPAVANLFLFNPKIIAFIVSMIAGMFIFRFTLEKK